MPYQITRQKIRLHCVDEDWFYQFTDNGEGLLEIAPYAIYGVEERKSGDTFCIPKDCLESFIATLQEMK